MAHRILGARSHKKRLNSAEPQPTSWDNGTAGLEAFTELQSLCVRAEQSHVQSLVAGYNREVKMFLTQEGDVALEGAFIEARQGTEVHLLNKDGTQIKARVDQCQYDGFPDTTLTAADGTQIPPGSYQLVWKWDWSHFDKVRKGLYANLDSPSLALWSVVCGNQLYVSLRNTLVPNVWLDLNTLTEEQRAAVAACGTHRIILLQSGPGCGKTLTGASMTYVLSCSSRTVVLVAKTNSALNELAQRVKDRFNIDVVRVYASSVPQDKRLATLTDFDTLAKDQRSAVKVLATTPVGFYKESVADMMFDWGLFDEATTLNEADVAIVLKRVRYGSIFLGDMRQGRPFVLSELARVKSFGRSPFHRLADAGVALFNLTRQFRMNPLLLTVPNAHLYDNTLVSGVTEQDRMSHLTNGTPVRMVNVVGRDARHQHGYSAFNRTEACACIEEVQRLLEQSVTVDKITVLCFYRAQNEEIRKLAKESVPGLEVATVAAYQGKEQDYVILSLCRSNMEMQIGIVSDVQWISVALTRARRGLIIVADQETIMSCETWRAVLGAYNKISSPVTFEEG